MEYIIVFLAIFLLQVVFFTYAALNKTDKVTDLSYGLTFVFGVIFAQSISNSELSLIKLILVVLISFWGIRLSGYLFIRVIKMGRDKRFDGIRESFVKLGAFWLIQAISVFIILLPALYLILSTGAVGLSSLTIVGLTISSLGILIEAIADQQKFIFKNNPDNDGKWIDTGIWKYSRHPNYLGEIMMWVGVFIYVLPLITGLGWLTIISPLQIILLLLFFSGIPTLERKYKERYKGNVEYENYVERTGILIPKIF